MAYDNPDAPRCRRSSFLREGVEILFKQVPLDGQGERGRTVGP